MSRKQPENAEHTRLLPPEVTKQSNWPERTMKIGPLETKMTVQTRQYKLITPLFGGGVEPGVNDLDNLIRATEIRGQLRFWWRAIRGGQFGGDLAAMKKREDEIWGTASVTKKQNEQDKSAAQENSKQQKWAEPVQIEVEIRQKGQSIKPFKLVLKKGRYKAEPDNGIPDYAAFPLRPDEEKLKRMGNHTPIADLQQHIEFDLKMTFLSEWANEVQAALWAWETFGGIGARTRRGFGALCLQSIDGKTIEDTALPPSDPNKARQWIVMKLQEYRGMHAGKPIKDVPRVDNGSGMRILGSFSQSADAWNALIDSLARFRQQRFDFRQQRFSPYGKSLWPEANALRKRLHANKDRARTPDKFPRAVFGLPIVFHLPHEHPSETITLQSAKKEGDRFASSLILKPIPCRGKQFLGLAVLLAGSDLPVEGLVLMRDGAQWETIPVEQTRLKSREIPDLEHVLGAEADILKAFLNYLKPGEK